MNNTHLFTIKANKAGMLAALISISIIALATSCSKSMNQENILMQDSEYESVTISLGSPVTEATKVAMGNINYDTHEAAVSYWAFFIFNEAGTSYVYRQAGIAKNATVSFKLPIGTYKVRAIANYPLSGTHALDINSVTNLTQFNALVSGLEDNALGGFVMAGTSGNGNITVTKTEGDEVIYVEINLKRLVSKVTLTNVTLDFEKTALRSKDVLLKHVYITNAYPFCRYGTDYATSELAPAQNQWFNCMGWHRDGGISLPSSSVSAIDALTADRNLNLQLTKNVAPTTNPTPTQVNRSYYFYPNPMQISADSHAETWSGPRCTRLILEVVIDSKTYYYQCNLPKADIYAPIRRNTAFTASCRITNLGSKDPEIEAPASVEWTFAATPVEDWDAVYNVSEDS